MKGGGNMAGATPDVHERIRIEAEELRSLDGGDFSDVDRRPALRALFAAAMERIEAGLPAVIDYQGQRYWLRVRVLADIAIHASPGDALPMAGALSAGSWRGHRPGH
ncbi:MAG: hypothetical protein JNM79_03945 [Burkholderiales bacterium]|nr:hypothetical protein [Burkholderiales bacterium]